MNIINLYENFNSYFNKDSKAIFEKISKIASKSGFKLYLIGGIVRDMLLNKKGLDIDITVEGDAIEFAHILEGVNAKILSVHQSFGTVKVEFPIGSNSQKIDFASTRSENYPKPGHLPHVDKIGCSLKEDVLRRDFTVNSLALSLNQDSFADLIDYVNGFEDLKSKKIRILHEKSFIDDPTRIIRALKYATKLGFELDKNTLKLQKEYLKNINYDMCYKRVKQEIKKTFEDNSQEAFEKFIEQNIYKLIRRSGIPARQHNIQNLINKYKPKHPWIVYFGVIAINENLERFELTKSEKNIIEDAKCLINKTLQDDFAIYKAFCKGKCESLLIAAVFGKEKEVRHYLDDLAKIKLHINGDDLIKLGLKPSKEFNKILDYVLKEKLKNPKMNKSKELEAAKFLLG